MPSGASLRDIAFILSSISANINKCMKEIHSAKLSGTLTEAQFAAMYEAIKIGAKSWKEPRDVLRKEMLRFKGHSCLLAQCRG